MADRRSALGLGLNRLADCYGGSVKADPHPAGELLLRGYSIHGVRDRAHIADRLAFLCQDTGRSDEAREWKRQAVLLREPTAPRPGSGRKAGRNEPCPHGSGRKYKKCCGSPAALRG